MPSTSTPPPTARHGTPAASARRATPRAVLPNPVWASMRPSPVMTRSAPARRASKSVASMTRSTPGRSANPANASWIASSAEPDPAGRTGTGHVPDGLRRARCGFEEIREASEAAVEEGDLVGGRALLGAVDRGRSGRSEQRVRHVACDRHPDVRQVRVEIAQVDRGERLGDAACRSPRRLVGRSPSTMPRASRTRHPSSRSHRCPGSRPGHPMPATARSTSPSPLDVAWTASRSPGATRDRPDDSAISMTPRAPSVERSQRAVIDRPSGSVASASCHSQPPAAATAARVPFAAVRERAQQDRVVEGGRATSRRRGRERPGPRSATP